MKCLRCNCEPNHANEMLRCFCIEPWMPDEETLYPEHSRTQLEEELLRSEAALFLAASEKTPNQMPLILRQLTAWQGRCKPIAENARRQKLERNKAGKIEIVN